MTLRPDARDGRNIFAFLCKRKRVCEFSTKNGIFCRNWVTNGVYWCAINSRWNKALSTLPCCKTWILLLLLKQLIIVGGISCEKREAFIVLTNNHRYRQTVRMRSLKERIYFQALSVNVLFIKFIKPQYFCYCLLLLVTYANNARAMRGEK